MSPSKLERARRHRSEVCYAYASKAWAVHADVKAREAALDPVVEPFRALVALRRSVDPHVHPARARRAFTGPARSYVHPANAPWSPHTFRAYERQLAKLLTEAVQGCRPAPWDRSASAKVWRITEDTRRRRIAYLERKLALLRPDLYVGPQWRDA